MKTVYFYSSVSDKSLFYTQKFYQIDIHILEDLGYNVVLSNKILDAFKFWKYDFVFAYFFRYSFFFILIAKLFGKKSYLTGGIDALDIEYVGQKEYDKQKLLFKLCCYFATKCIIVSSEDLKHVEEIAGKNNKKIYYSEHTIDTSEFICNIPFERKCDNFITIGWQGSEGNIKRKGIDKSIEIFNLLAQKKEFKSSKLIILGKKGLGTPYLEKLIAKSPVSNRILLLGEVSEAEKIKYLQENKYYFQLSHYEGFGVAVLEALIAGAFIIHSGKGGLKNKIYDNHIMVDIDSELSKQLDGIYLQLQNSQVNKERVVSIAKHYDNERRAHDFLCILNS